MKKQIPYYEEIDYEFSANFLNTIGWEGNQFHFHKSYEIYFAWTDGMQYLVNNKIYHVNKGDLLIFNNMDIHRSLPPIDREYQRYMILFNPEYIERYSTHDTDLLGCFRNHNIDFNHLIHLDIEEQVTFLNLFKNAEHILKAKKFGDDIRRKIQLIDILLYINERYKIKKVTNNFEGNNEMSNLLIYIQEHIDKPIKLDDLSKRYLVNKNLLNKRFKAYTGFSINQYLIHYRIMVAKRYLQNGDTVTDTATKVGYTNFSHFIRTFHNIVGISPKQYSIKSK